MNLNKLNDWLQFAAAVGVLIGLMLVAYERRQEHELARAQLGLETLTAQQDVLDSLQDTATAQAYVKALEAPETLTLAEQVILHAFFAEVVSATVSRHQYMNARGVFEAGLTLPADIAARYIFSSDYGRQWWEVRRLVRVPQVRAAIDAAARDIDISLMESAVLIKERARQQMEQQR